MTFNDEVFSLQWLETFFVFLLWSKTKLSTKGVPSTLVNFLDWLGCTIDWVFFLVLPSGFCAVFGACL